MPAYRVLHFCEDDPKSYELLVSGIKLELISALNTILSVLRSPKVIVPAELLPALNVISPSTTKLPLTFVFLWRVIDSEPSVVFNVR